MYSNINRAQELARQFNRQSWEDDSKQKRERESADAIRQRERELIEEIAAWIEYEIPRVQEINGPGLAIEVRERFAKREEKDG
jgi:hypothetical protein